MAKLLTISIAAYNVEKYIENTLNSLLLEKYMDRIEVFVVDDGSKDNIEKIVIPYVERYPETFVYHKKENGGYGSTINWSIRNANGEFFKVLDGDDTMDQEGLVELIEILEKTSADIIVSQAIRCFPDGRTVEIYPFINQIGDGIYSIKNNAAYADVAVWGYTIRTNIVKKCWIDLPLHSFYTDRLFVLHALSAAETIQYQKNVVYKYRIGIDEQSTSVRSIRNHYKEAINVDLNAINWFVNDIKEDNPRYEYLANRLALNFAYTYCMFLDLDINSANLDELKEYVEKVKTSNIKLYEIAISKVYRVKLVEKTKYLAYYLWPILKRFRR